MLHRTPTKFTSFTWGPKRMALALPRDGNWMLWSHFELYVGRIEAADPDAKPEVEVAFEPEMSEDGFAVTGQLRDFGGAVMQDIAYVSPPGDLTVCVERVSVRDGFGIRSREGGIVGLEYPLGGNRRVLRGGFGRLEAVGVGGDEPRVVPLGTDWLSIADRVGYLVRRIPERANVMRYHDEPRGSGRVPALQEWISLVEDAGEPALGPRPEWACIVTLLNADAAATAPR